MADKTTELAPADHPQLEPGDYTVHVTLSDAKGEPLHGKASPEPMSFRVAAPPQKLAPQDISGQFPARDARGPLAGVIPHVVLRSSALPWMYGDELWLALVLMLESEGVSLVEDGEGGRRLHVPDSVSDRVVPTVAQRGKLAHVRYRTEPIPPEAPDTLKAPRKTKRGVLLCNRRIAGGQSGRVCLISMRNPTDSGDGAKRYRCLHSWRFHSTSEAVSKFVQVFCRRVDPDGDGLDIAPFALPCPTPAEGAADWELARHRRLAAGYTPLPLEAHDGIGTVAWYRGPLVPVGTLAPGVTDPGQGMPLHADALVSRDTVTGLADVTYAAAWELGRLLALGDAGFRDEIVRWRRRSARDCHHRATHDSDRRRMDHTHCAPPLGALPLPTKFFERLATLQEVPLGYLVPDERMLPQESLRAVALDPLWVYRLLQGAFSLGAEAFRCSDDDPATGHLRSCERGALKRLKVIARLGDGAARPEGFLLRSEVNSLWPDLEVDAEPRSGEEVERLADFPRRLAPELRFDLFAERLSAVTFVQPRIEPHYEEPSDLRWEPTPGFLGGEPVLGAIGSAVDSSPITFDPDRGREISDPSNTSPPSHPADGGGPPRPQANWIAADEFKYVDSVDVATRCRAHVRRARFSFGSDT